MRGVSAKVGGSDELADVGPPVARRNRVTSLPQPRDLPLVMLDPKPAEGQAASATPAVAFRGVSKQYGAHTALQPLDLEIREGEFFCLLGPSGCGKTTTLNLIGGFAAASTGEIRIRGELVTTTPPHRRKVNTVFQSYALFPHLNVRDNVAFGLRMAKVPRGEIDMRVLEALRLVDLDAFADRYPAQLSGGQQQRVAVARALVNRPAVLLLDEPLGALDLKLRKRLQAELSQIQREVGTTFVFVTHDQGEAMAIGDRIAVMNEGRVEQIGTAKEIYMQPASRFVADFIGESNLIPVDWRDGVVATSQQTIPLPSPDTTGSGQRDPDGAPGIRPSRHRVPGRRRARGHRDECLVPREFHPGEHRLPSCGGSGHCRPARRSRASRSERAIWCSCTGRAERRSSSTTYPKNQHEEGEGMTDHRINRRDALKAGGVGALGLAAFGSRMGKALAAAPSSALSTSKTPLTMNMLTWNDHYYPQTQWPYVKNQTGISVNVTLGSDDGSMFVKAQQSGQYDDRVSRRGLGPLLPPEWARSGSSTSMTFPAAKNLYSVARDFPMWSGSSGYMAYPRAWSALRIYYNPKYVNPAPTSYEVLLNPKYAGKFVRENQPTDIVAEAGLATGAKEPYNMNAAELSRAVQFLQAAKPAYLDARLSEHRRGAGPHQRDGVVHLGEPGYRHPGQGGRRAD